MPLVHAWYPRQTRRQPFHSRCRTRVLRRHLRPHPLQHRPCEEPDLDRRAEGTAAADGRAAAQHADGRHAARWSAVGHPRRPPRPAVCAVRFDRALFDRQYRQRVRPFSRSLRHAAPDRRDRPRGRARRGHHARQRGDVERIARLRDDHRRRRGHHGSGRRGTRRRLLRLAHCLHRRRHHGHRAARSSSCSPRARSPRNTSA